MAYVAQEVLIEYIKENQEKMYKTAFTYVHDRDEALDIVQESIAKALQNINKLKYEEYVKTWFYRILINESLQHIKKNKRNNLYEIENLENEIADYSEIPIENIEIYKCINKLNEKIRTVIILRFFEDMKIEEIAYSTRTNENTVKSRLYKGIQELKKMIEGGKN